MMLSLFTRRVTLSAHRSTATYTRILSCPVSTLRAKTTSGTKPHTGTIRTFANPQRNASTKASAATKKTESSTTTGRTKPKRGLTPEQKAVREQTLRAKKELEKKKAERAAALRAKRKAQEVKKKEAAVQKRKQLVEKRKKLAEAKKAKEKERKQKEKEKVQKEKEKREEQKKAREAKKPMCAYIMISWSCEMLYSMAYIVCASYQPPSKAHEPVLGVPPGNQETYQGGRRRLAQSI